MIELCGLAVVGTGSAARTHLEYYRTANAAQVKWTCSRSEERGASLAGEFGIPNHCTTLDPILADPEVHLVDICSIPSAHVDIAEVVLDHGKGVIIEKPLDIDVDKALTFQRKAAASPHPVLVVYQYPYSNTFDYLRECCQSGEFGRLLHVKVIYNSLRTEDYYRDSWTARKNQAGGGVLINQGIHMINLVHGWLGYPPASYAATATSLRHNMAVEDTVVIHAEYRDGPLGLFQFSTGWDTVLNIALVFERAAVSTSGGQVKVAASHDRVVPTPGKGTFGHLFQDFLARRKTDPGVTMGLNAAVEDLRIISVIYEAARTGQRRSYSPALPLDPATR